MKKNKFYLFLGAAPVLSVPLVAASCGDKYFKETEVDGVKTVTTLSHIVSRKGLKLRDGLTVDNAPRASIYNWWRICAWWIIQSIWLRSSS
nr:variable surface lipoprotein [Mycoplasmopsis bovis]